MKVFRTIEAVPLTQGSVVTIGNFDGLHRGHQALLNRLRDLAKAADLLSTVILFEPHPAEFFSPDHAPARISRLRDKLAGLNALQIDQVIVLRFDTAFSQLSAKHFIERYLIQALHAQYVLVGDDFRFGYQREGNSALLKHYAPYFQVQILEKVIENEHRISSTHLRQLFHENNLAAITHLLGHPYTWSGVVRHGDALGRTLGFPTANLMLPSHRLPLHGVFAVHLQFDGVSHPAVANVGVRPTLNGKKRLLEVHLLNFEGDLYDKRVEIEFLHKIRSEKRFESLEDLKRAIAEDVQAARDFFKE